MDLRVAVIGYGLAGAVFHAPLIETTPGMRVAAIVTGNPQRQADARRTHPDARILPSPDEIWNAAGEYDLTVVAAPNRAHVPLGLASIDAGIPVVVDKPLAPSVAQGRALIERSEQTGVPVTVFQNRRWDGDFLTLRALIERDLLGPIVHFESRFERYRPAPRPGAWRELPDPGEAGGLLFDLGSHLIDQALVLFGTPRDVYAEVGIRRPGAQVDDDTFIALRFESGVQVHLWMNVVVRTLGPRFSVSGLRGSYVKYGLDPQEPALKDGLRPGDPDWGIEPPEAWGRLSTEIEGLHVDGATETLPGRYESFYAELAGALRSANPLPVNPRDALRTLEIIEAAQASSREGRVIRR